MIFPDVIPETAPPKYPDLYEVINGEIRELNPWVRQTGIASRLGGFVWSFVRPKRLGRTILYALFDLRDGQNQRRPDVAFVSAQRWPLDLELPDTEAWHVVPELVVEVPNPTTTYNEIQQKKDEYFQAGVVVVWVVSTELRKIEIFDNRGGFRERRVGDVLKEERVLPGFELPLRELFSKRYQ